MKLLFTASPGKSQVMEQNDKENSILRNKFTHLTIHFKSLLNNFLFSFKDCNMIMRTRLLYEISNHTLPFCTKSVTFALLSSG